ncbi:hypothetical protein PFICI_02018 [Pestalotiopsis fici W106-1]|uniref:Uncharacterized protein n=1 Tax=Pestalotiopsis fici (strain W106-1 / CGMCC3.15140) TaxID=1229662 RepID=W3XQE0_PESFW|nr:uncharacterized protein PFICI_02018 [Pestalotiopsis fici W106-1]ETS88190.1 hypothetical protein PFICI_02018 [Pestalotiopsis fici W106-1]
MCYTIHYVSRNCGHHWLEISQPCWPGQGFNSCDTFGDGIARSPSPLAKTQTACPACSGAGCYDKHRFRMIMHVKNKYKVGEGPCKHEPGCECVIL